MSNTGRGEHGKSVSRSRSKVGPEVKLETLRLYLLYQNSNTVGEKLGISGAAVRDRLYAMGVKTRSSPGEDVVVLNGKEFLDDLRRRLREMLDEPN